MVIPFPQLRQMALRQPSLLRRQLRQSQNRRAEVSFPLPLRQDLITVRQYRHMNLVSMVGQLGLPVPMADQRHHRSALHH
jgi:hypothetical protein